MSDYKWTFQRIGGMDQAMLATADEIRNLAELDPKLWCALSCPSSGMEFDERTMKLIDRDGDGRIRIPEVLHAVKWLSDRLHDPSVIIDAPESLTADQLSDTPEGNRLAQTFRAVLAEFGFEPTAPMTLELAEKAAQQAAGRLYNGDGVIPPHSELSEDIREFIRLGLILTGGTADESGQIGLDKAGAAKTLAVVRTWLEWYNTVEATPHPAGEDTGRAYALLNTLTPKIDEYFLRCRMAEYAPQATAGLNAEVTLSAALDNNDLSAETLAALPLSRVTENAVLRLDAGLNPQWRADVEAFAVLIRPLMNDSASICETDWNHVKAAFEPFGAAMRKRPDFGSSEADAALDALGKTGAENLIGGGIIDRFNAAADHDLSTAAAGNDVADMRRLLLYANNLYRLLMNFVSFREFYAMSGRAIFQTGTLYIDGRACRLCLPAQAASAHAELAKMSQMCLLYCECTQTKGVDKSTMGIVAAVTVGGDDYLTEGRNGVFVDNTGQDWDARLVKIVRNPISLRDAMWSPYKRISALMGSQIAKFAANKSQTLVSQAGSKINKTTSGLMSGTPSAPFDISKSVGLFAAVGIALGAIGTAVGSIAGALLALKWWQLPLLIIGTFVIISGPSVLLAWIKLRQRTLAPLLEASGWAVNSRLPIGLKLGSALTTKAELPKNIAMRGVIDPFKDKESHSWMWILAVLVVAGIAAGWWLWYSGKFAWMCKIVETAVSGN